MLSVSLLSTWSGRLDLKNQALSPFGGGGWALLFSHNFFYIIKIDLYLYIFRYIYASSIIGFHCTFSYPTTLINPRTPYNNHTRSTGRKGMACRHSHSHGTFPYTFPDGLEEESLRGLWAEMEEADIKFPKRGIAACLPVHAALMGQKGQASCP